ncbi:hypothetical protein LDENG_00017720 [Lucifuga dentata]|nr:hypothetical protein LDENG_00017720 [Lucifuga dentata]
MSGRVWSASCSCEFFHLLKLPRRRKRLVQVLLRAHGSMVNNQPATRTCAGCGGKIADRFLLFSMERYWHTRCLKCSCCQAQLGDIGTSCYSKGGMILCRSDYIRLFGHSGACSACGQSIPANEMVMRAQGNVYHLKCFSCATCRNRLMPGDRFHYINGTIFCEHDRPGAALLNSHLPPLQSNALLADQKVNGGGRTCLRSRATLCWQTRRYAERRSSPSPFLRSFTSLLSCYCRCCCGFLSPSCLSSPWRGCRLLQRRPVRHIRDTIYRIQSHVYVVFDVKVVFTSCKDLTRWQSSVGTEEIIGGDN